MFENINKKDFRHIKNPDMVYNCLILKPYLRLICCVDFEYNKKVYEYVSSQQRLDYVFKKFNWCDEGRDEIKRALNIIIDYFETCKNEDLAIYCYKLFLKYQKQNYTDKKLGLFWKQKKLNCKGNSKLYEFYEKSMKELGGYGERALQRLKKEIKLKK